MRIRVLAWVAVLGACSHPAPVAPAGAKDDPRIARVEAELVPAVRIRGAPATGLSLAARMEHHHVGALSVAVIEGGRIAWARGYGPGITPETLFQAGSISKPVAAAAALRLVARGKLSLDEDVNRKLTSWKVPDDPLLTDAPVTLRRLLSHTAGLTVHGFPGYDVDAALPTLRQVLDGAPPANTEPIRVDLRPGTVWRYSGGGYTVAQELMIDVTGEPFPQILDELVLRPLGMEHSSYRQPLPADWAGRTAEGRYSDGRLVHGRWHVYPEMAAAGLWTTPSDLCRFVLELQAPKVLDAATVALMTTVVMQGYGLGLSIEGEGPARRFGHGGSDEGFQAQMVGYVQGGRGAVVMAASDNGGTIAAEILRAVAREYAWPDYPQGIERAVVQLPPEKLAALKGVYAGPGFDVQLDVRDGRIFAFVTSQPHDVLELFAESDSRLFGMDHPIDVELVEGGIRVHMPGAPDLVWKKK